MPVLRTAANIGYKIAKRYGYTLQAQKNIVTAFPPQYRPAARKFLGYTEQYLAGVGIGESLKWLYNTFADDTSGNGFQKTNGLPPSSQVSKTRSGYKRRTDSRYPERDRCYNYRKRPYTRYR